MRSDEIIKKDIVDELYWNDRIDASKVNVTVENGSVTLSGEVPTYGDLIAARSAAWNIVGVIDVVEDLTVSYVSPPALPSDDEIQQRVNNILTWEPAVDETEIIVTVVGGIVTLKGNVDGHWKKRFVENRISGIRGIVAIENKIAVVPSMRMDDEAIAQDIVAALDRDVLVDAENVTVSVNNGVVSLVGAVPGLAARKAAEEDASLTAGVIGVRNELKLAA
ncbi:MAG: BON domain-containing protein [Verrucomicrobiota bacterium]